MSRATPRPQIAQHSSKTNEHYTPEEIVEAGRQILGVIDLDPASCAKANKAVRAAQYFNRRDDGLMKPWPGRVFLNPPGGLVRLVRGRWRPVPKNENGRYKGPGDSSMAVWWDHLCRQWQSGVTDAALFVGFTLEILRVSQAYPLPVQNFSRCYPRDRLRFGGAQPTHANVIVYLPPTTKSAEISFQSFREVFGKFGLCEPGPCRLSMEGV